MSIRCSRPLFAFTRVAAVAAFAVLALSSVRAMACDGANCMDPGTESELKRFLADPHRDAARAARDRYRHPLETLKFFGLKDNMTVLEIWPSSGWWTEFLAPTLAQKGKYIAGQPAPGGEGDEGSMLSNFHKMLDSDPARFGKTQTIAFTPKGGVPDNSVDMVLTFRNLHNWMSDGNERQWIAAMYRALKPGGYLGIEEHRASSKAPQDPKARSGYVREDYAKQLFESQGFKLVSESEVNSNRKDTKDYPGGVWTLPPTYAEGAKDRAKYAAIGESDRFTLLFQKPK